MTNNNQSELVTKLMKLKIPVMLMPLDSLDTDSNEDCDIDTEINIWTRRIDNPADEPGNSIHERYIILYDNNVDEDDKTNKLNNIPGFKSKHKFKNTFKGCSATINKGLLRQLMDDPDILILEKDTLMYDNSYSKEKIDESTESFKQVSYWHQTLTNTVPQLTDNFSNVHCYVLDTGILPNHTEFNSGQVIMAYNAINKTTRAQDDNGHGTAVASMIGGKTTGVANKTLLYSIKVLGTTGSGYVSDIIAGLNWVMANKKTPCIINMSLGGGLSTTLNAAVQNCLNSGIQVVCATGNSGVDASNTSPANATGAIAVSAYDSSKTKPSWSNYGKVVATFAPGSGVRAAWGDSTNSYFLVNGTSFACPITCGILVRYLKEYPNATPTEIKSFLSRVNLQNEIINPGSETTPNLRVVWEQTRTSPC